MANNAFQMAPITDRIDNEIDKLSEDSTTIQRVNFNRSVTDFRSPPKDKEKHGDDSEYSDDEMGSRHNSASRRKDSSKRGTIITILGGGAKSKQKPPLSKSTRKGPSLKSNSQLMGMNPVKAPKPQTTQSRFNQHQQFKYIKPNRRNKSP
jgi:hypothetical protein